MLARAGIIRPKTRLRDSDSSLGELHHGMSTKSARRDDVAAAFPSQFPDFIQGGNTRQLLQKEIEEEHRAAAVELVLRRRAMIKELYSREAQQCRYRRNMCIDWPLSSSLSGLN